MRSMLMTFRTRITVAGSAVAQILGFAVVIDNDIPALTASTTGGPVSVRFSILWFTVRFVTLA
jgi:hypothetical protein